MASVSMTTPLTFTTSAFSPTTRPAYHELLRRDGECGDLQGNYPNAVAPTCQGSFSLCTFTAGQQGCCDGSNNCQFFTSCNGGLATGTAKCTASDCLQCPVATPYCTAYEFAQGLSAYTGFACGGISIPADIVVQGIVATGQVAATSTSVSSRATTSSKSGSSQTSRTSTNSSATPTATGNSQPSNQTGIHLSKYAIIGIAVGGGVAIFALLFLIYWKYIRNRNTRDQKPMLEPLRYQQIPRG